jgi:hypothetical protein
MRPGVSGLHVVLSLCFSLWFVMTLAGGLSSFRRYMSKTVVVVLYSLVTCADHGLRYTIIEWIADGLVWYHFVSVFWFLQVKPRGVNG